ncbi:hypothetical protein K432DRAFT_292567, partial [Lepidopterella palustris CBS 459.81]
YLSILFKIRATDGSIIWRLSGKKNEFDFAGISDPIHYGFQHHARIRSQKASTTVISIFGNASDGVQNTSTFSWEVGMLMDARTKVCTYFVNIRILRAVLSKPR